MHRQVGGDPGDVGPQTALALGGERGLHDGVVAVAALEVAADRQEAGTGAQGERGRARRAAS